MIDCAKRVMKDHCYWPLASDFNNVLSHESVALVFLKDDNLIDMWFQFLSMLQGECSLRGSCLERSILIVHFDLQSCNLGGEFTLILMEDPTKSNKIECRSRF